MPYPYVRLDKNQYRAGEWKYMLTDKVPLNCILNVKHMGVYSTAIASGDTLSIGFFDGTNYIPLYVKLQETPVSALAEHCDFSIPAGYQIYGYFDNIAAGETIELAVLGDMYTVDEWERAHGGKS